MLFENERKVLKATVEYIEENGYAPSVREICELVGIKSTSTVHGQLTKLEDKGYVKRKEKSPRAMVILKEGE